MMDPKGLSAINGINYSRPAINVKDREFSFRTRVMLATQNKVQLQQKLALEKYQCDPVLLKSSDSGDADQQKLNMDSDVERFHRVASRVSKELRNKIHEVTECCRTNSLQTEFDFSGCQFGYEGVVSVLVAMYFKSSNISKLDLSDCNLEARGVSVVYKIVGMNSSIKELSLSRNNIGQSGLNWIRNMLQFSELRVLNLSHNGLNDTDLEEVMRGLLETDTLRDLDLSHNLLGISAGTLISRYLPGNRSLRCLNLSHNDIRPEGIRDMILGLQENNYLERLDLSWNSLKDEGMVYVAEILLRDVSLKELALNGNFINEVGAQYVSQSLRDNSCLEVLEMAQNFLRNQGACALLRGLRSSASSRVKLLDLNGTLVEKEFATLYKKTQLDKSFVEITGFCVVDESSPTFRMRKSCQFK